MKKLLLVEHGGDSKSFIFEVLKDRELELYVAATTLPRWLLDYVPKDRIITADTYTGASLISAIKAYSAETGVTFGGVGTYFEHVVVQTAELARSLGLPGINPDAAKRSSSNKLLMRDTCRAAGIKMPQYVSVIATTPEILLREIVNFGFPCVVKPVFGSQSYGVIKFEKKPTVAEVEEVFSLTTTEKKEVFKNFRGEFLIEEYLSGTVLSADGFVQGGVISFAGVIEFVMSPEPHFTQEANLIPPTFPTNDQEKCKEYAAQVVRALGFNDCGFHCEMRLTPNGPRLIEIACRLPGGPLQLGYQRASGAILALNLVDIWFGTKTILAKTHDSFVVQKAVFPRVGGTITVMTGMDEAAKIPGVWDFVQICDQGETVITYPNVPKPFYYYAAEADSREALDALMCLVESTAIVQVK